ncbi:cation:proton antiporter [Shewanella salipaludis]|nr:cation:proton antiporter [Shewanella salipaludis]
MSMFLILLLGRLLSELGHRLGWPSVVGEILAGLLIGPSLLNWVTPDPTLAIIAELGVILLLFDIGCKTSMKHLYHSGRSVFWVALLGIILPGVSTGLAAAYWLELSTFSAIFFGCALTATSIGISLRVLTQAGQQQNPAGHIILGAAVVDDIVGVALLSLMFNFAISGRIDLASTARLSLVIVAFLLLSLIATRMLIYLFRALQPRAKHSGYETLAAMSLIYLFTWLAHWVGAPTLLGGFIVGMALSRQFVSPINRYLQNPFSFTHQLEQATRPLVDMLAPVFFVYIGISLDLSQLHISWSGLAILLWLSLIAIVSKLLAGLVVKGNWRQKLLIGSAMIPRGEVGLVFAKLGHQLGVLPPKLFAELILIIAITTLIGPLLLKWVLSGQQTHS